MNVTTYISDILIQGLATALLHSIWQGLVIALLLSLIIYLIPRSNVQLKYWLSVTALVGLLFWTGYTFNQSLSFSDERAIVSNAESIGFTLAATDINIQRTSGLTSLKSYVAGMMDAITPYMDTLVLIWVLGVLVFLLRLQGSIFYLRRLKNNGCRPVPGVWQQKAQLLSHQLGIRITVNLLESKLAEVPMVIGHLKPVILIPMGMLSGLSPAEVEAILAHELAHVKRYDYLINIIQTVVESLLFFNPALWYISHTIRKHREHCCDDIAVKCCGNKMIYANALSNLGAWSLRTPTLSMGLFKSRNELLMRIKRLVYPQMGSQAVKNKLVPGIILTLAVICLSWYSHRVQAQLMPVDPDRTNFNISAEIQPDPVNDTLPELEIEREVDVDEELEMEVEVDVNEEFEVEQAIEVEWEVDTADPHFEAFENIEFLEDIFANPPNVAAFAQVPDVFVVPDVMFSPDVFVNPDIRVEVEELVDLENIHQNLDWLNLQMDDTTRERIMKALEEQRQALERAMEEQEEALAKAREHLHKSLQAERPEDLTEEEWDMAKEKIQQAERSLERALERSNHELERALEDQQYHVHRHIDRVIRENADRNRIVLKHVQKVDEERIQHGIARAHAHANRLQYRWDTGNEAELRKSLLKDGLIDEYDSDISLSFSKSQIKVNDIKLEGEVKQRYREMLDDMYGEDSTGSLTFSD